VARCSSRLILIVNSMSVPNQKTGPRRLTDFTTKVLSLSLIGEQWARVLVYPRWEVKAGRLFLVGEVPPGGSTNDWLAGLTDTVAWDQVNAYLTFDSPAHYAKRLAIHNRKKRRS